MWGYDDPGPYDAFKPNLELYGTIILGNVLLG